MRSRDLEVQLSIAEKLSDNERGMRNSSECTEHAFRKPAGQRDDGLIFRFNLFKIAFILLSTYYHDVKIRNVISYHVTNPTPQWR